MKRREFITLLGGTAVAWPLTARAQQQLPMLRVGDVSGQPRSGSIFVALEQRMAELGYQAGKNLTLEFVHASSIEGFEAGYKELAGRKVDIILASGPEISLKSALAAAGTLPIVMIAIDYDPFPRGYVASLARPNGNVTGVFFQQIELSISGFNCSWTRFQICGAQRCSGTPIGRPVAGDAERRAAAWIAACWD